MYLSTSAGVLVILGIWESALFPEKPTVWTKWVWGFRGMLLADLQMPSITGSEAVDKYIYIPERPPDNQILIKFVILSLIQKKPLNPVFPTRLLLSEEKPD